MKKEFVTREFATQLLQLICAFILVKIGQFEYAVILYLATIFLELRGIFNAIISKK